MPGRLSAAQLFAAALALAALALAAVAIAGAAGCRTPQKAYASPMPPFVIRYPAAWRQMNSADRYGPLVVFSPDEKVGPESTRITLQVTTARPRRPPEPGRGFKAPNLVVEQSLGEVAEGLVGHRWFVTIYPSAVVIEVYAPPRKFARIKGVADRMARDIRKSVTDEPGPWGKRD